MALQDFQQQVVDEKAALDEKIKKLGIFFDSAVYHNLSYVDQEILYRQFNCMKPYSAVLGERIKRFE